MATPRANAIYGGIAFAILFIGKYSEIYKIGSRCSVRTIGEPPET